MKSKLLRNTHDGSLTECKIRPQGDETVVEFAIQYYRREDGEERIF